MPSVELVVPVTDTVEAEDVVRLPRVLVDDPVTRTPPALEVVRVPSVAVSLPILSPVTKSVAVAASVVLVLIASTHLNEVTRP